MAEQEYDTVFVHPDQNEAHRIAMKLEAALEGADLSNVGPALIRILSNVMVQQSFAEGTVLEREAFQEMVYENAETMKEDAMRGYDLMLARQKN